LTNQLKVAGLQRATQSKHTFDSAVNATAHDVGPFLAAQLCGRRGVFLTS
jgi:hypothetical protein